MVFVFTHCSCHPITMAHVYFLAIIFLQNGDWCRTFPHSNKMCSMPIKRGCTLRVLLESRQNNSLFRHAGFLSVLTILCGMWNRTLGHPDNRNNVYYRLPRSPLQKRHHHPVPKYNTSPG